MARLKRILCVLDGGEDVVFGYVRHHGLGRDGFTELYEITPSGRDAGWDPFIVTADDLLEVVDAEGGAS